MLSRDQERVVTLTGSNTLLNCPPGAGKTLTIAKRIIKIIKEDGCPADKILCLTHTKEATENTRQRLLEFLPSQTVSKITIGTIHSFATELIFSLPSYKTQNWSLADRLDRLNCAENDKKRLKIYEIIDRYPDQDPVDVFIRKCDKLQENMHQDPTNFNKRNPTKPLARFEKDILRIREYREIACGYDSYRQEMRRRRLYTYDHIITETLRAIREDNNLLSHLQSCFKHILIDECQDIGEAQLLLLKALVGTDTVVMIAGDENQSIYSFNGTVRNPYQRIQQEFGGSFTEIQLSKNYRSTEIISSLSRFIATGITSPSNRSLDGEIPIIREYDTQDAELISTARHIKDLIDAGVLGKDIVVLAPYHRTLIKLGEYLSYYRVPFNPSRRTDISALPSTRQILLLLSFIVMESDPSTSTSADSDGILFRLLHCKTLLGASTPSSEEVRGVWKTHGKNIREWALNHEGVSNVASAIKKILACAHKCINESPARIFQIIYAVFFPAKKHLGVFLTLIDNARTEEQKSSSLTLADYADRLERLIMDREFTIEEIVRNTPQENDGCVRLYTCHSSKSLGFEHVFLIDSTQKSWEVKKNIFDMISHDIKELEAEKRRLFHVAVSRSKRGLYISYHDEPCDYVKEVVDGGFGIQTDTIWVDDADILLINASIVNDEVDDNDMVFEHLNEVTMSVSLLLDAEECPFKARLERLDGINLQPKSTDNGRNTALLNGIKIHSILEDLHRNRKVIGRFPEDIQDFLIKHPLSAELCQDKIDTLQKFIENRQSKWESEYNSSLDVLTEKTLESVIDGCIRLKGTMDRVIMVSDKELVISDYKTGKRDPEKFHTQATFYTLLARLNGFTESSRAYFDLLNEDVPDVCLKIGDSDIENLKNRIINCYKELQGNKLRQCGKSYCAWCGWMLSS